MLQLIGWLHELFNVLQEDTVRADTFMQINICFDLHEMKFRLGAHHQYRLMINELIIYMGGLMYDPEYESINEPNDEENQPINLCIRDIVNDSDNDSEIEIVYVTQECDNNLPEIILSEL